MKYTDLFPFQREDVRQIERWGGRCLIANDMGLAKTSTSLYWGLNYLDMDDGPIVVVCPNTVKSVWRNQCKEHFGIDAVVLNGRKPGKQMGLPSEEADVYVVNYDILGLVSDKTSWARWLLRINPQLFIIDESFYIKSRTARRTKEVRAFAAQCPYVLALAGTPLTNRPVELFTTLNAVRPDLWPNFFAFAQEYCDPKQGAFGWDYTGASNLDKLHITLKTTMMIRRTKAEVLVGVPPKVRCRVPVEFDESGKRQYKLAEDDFISWLIQYKAQRMDRAMKANALVKIGYLRRLVGTLKLKAVWSWVDEFLKRTEGKLILFGVHKAVLKPTLECFNAQAVLVDGEVTGRNRDEAVRRFLNDPTCRLFLGNIQAAGVGWSAKGVSDVAFCETEWAPGLHDQAEDRCYGIGRGVEGVPTSSWWLVAEGTIEDRILKILDHKAKVIAQVLDGAGIEDVNVFHELIRQYQQEGEDRVVEFRQRAKAAEPAPKPPRPAVAADPLLITSGLYSDGQPAQWP